MISIPCCWRCLRYLSRAAFSGVVNSIGLYFLAVVAMRFRVLMVGCLVCGVMSNPAMVAASSVIAASVRVFVVHGIVIFACVCCGWI